MMRSLLRRVKTVPLRWQLLYCSAQRHATSHFSSTDNPTVPVPSPSADSTTSLPSQHIDSDEHDADAEPIDLVEAGLQEAHDLLCAMQACLKLPKSGITSREVEVVSAKFREFGEKLARVLTKEVIDALFVSCRLSADEFTLTPRGSRLRQPYTVSAPRRHNDPNSIEVHRSRLLRPVSQFFKHAPFEVVNARAHAPAYLSQHAKAERDRDTLALIHEVCSQQPYNANDSVVRSIFKRFDEAPQRHETM